MTHPDRVRGAVRPTWNRPLVAPVAVLSLLMSSGSLLVTADEPAAADAAADFQPGDISIGEPIALPFSQRMQTAGSEAAAAPGAAAALPRTPRFAPQPVAAEPEAAALPPSGGATGAPPLPGSGWLGFAVVESAVAGRWEVDTVAAGGPAAAAGIRPGDEIRAIDGLPLKSSDDVSQAMTSVAPGQDVRLAIARGEQVGDLTVTATARPPAASAWAAAAPLADREGPAKRPQQSPVAGVPSPQAAVAPPAAVPAPPASVAAPASAELPQPAATAPARRQAAVSPQPRSAQADQRAPAAPARDLLTREPARLAHEAVPATKQGRTALGVRTLPVDPTLQSRFNLPQPRGAYVIGVVSDLPAARAGVPPGSVIVSLDDSPVDSPAELTRLVTSGPVGRPVSLEYVLPGGGAQRAEVVLQTLERPLEEALVGPPAPTPTAVPSLQQQPRPAAATTTRRPVTSFDAGAVSAMQDEIRWLRSRLDQLEQRLEGEAR